MGLSDAKVGDHVSRGDLAGEVTEIDEAGSIRVKWFNEKEGATWEQPNDLELVTKAEEVSTEKPRDVVEEGTAEATVNTKTDVVVFLVKDTQVKVTGRVKSKASVAFLEYIKAAFVQVEDRLYKAGMDLDKDEFKLFQKTAKKAGLALEVIEMKEPKKRLSPKERARQKDIAARRLAQLAAARKNLAAKRGVTKTTKAVEASVDGPAPETKEESESAAA